ncbi:chromosomal replication initiator DnaA [Marinovum sp.]|uniref:chromosomal replication initiator DnaA n=1 Tax=Marinovum sp. TaxID=2024839 RepID=UPI003A8F3A6B
MTSPLDHEAFLMTRQLKFDLTTRPALGREDFYVSPANAVALAMLDSWRDWPNRKLVLKGARGSGKTHLAHVWAEMAGARIIRAVDLPEANVGELAQAPLCIEDAEGAAGNPDAEAHMFHLHNLVLAEGHALLLTTTLEPAHWALDLPDLKSRVQGTQVVSLNPPDDELLGAVLGKLFSDRQISPNPDVIPYLVRHAPRSFDAARRIVGTLDDMALGLGKPMSREMARRAVLSLRDFDE